MANKYTINDLAHDIAYIAIFVGLILLIIGYFPEISNRIIHFKN